MKKISFKDFFIDTIHIYELASASSKWFDKTLWKNNPTLYEKLLIGYNESKSDFDKLFNNYAYLNATYGENILLYEKVIWDLVKDKNIWVVINGQTEKSITLNSGKIFQSKWIYRAENKSKNEDKIFNQNDLKFANMQQLNTVTGNAVQIKKFDDLIAILKYGISDDYYLINIIALSENNDISDALTSSSEPILSNLLKEDGILISLFLGCDEGYLDHLQILSFKDLDLKIAQITEYLNRTLPELETKIINAKQYSELNSLIFAFLTDC